MSKVDWSRAPRDAEFFANGHFRKRVTGIKKPQKWILTGWVDGSWSLNECVDSLDYDPRPTVSVNLTEWPPEQRIDIIGTNGNDGLVYNAPERTTGDLINKPKHYQLIGDLEAIDVIAMAMTEDQFFGYCLGNILKYRLRNGKKGSSIGNEDLDKANKYEQLFEDKKHLCR